MEYVTHIRMWAPMSVPLNEDLAAKHVSDKAKRGYYRVVDSLSGGVGVDMRGRTAHDTHSYYMRGVIHHLDTKSYQVLQRYFAKRRFLTVLAKNLIEAGEYAELAREYDVTTEGFAQGGRPQKADSELAAALASMA